MVWLDCPNGMVKGPTILQASYSRGEGGQARLHPWRPNLVLNLHHGGFRYGVRGFKFEDSK